MTRIEMYLGIIVLAQLGEKAAKVDSRLFKVMQITLILKDTSCSRRVQEEL